MDVSVIGLFMNASWVVKAVMLLLLAASVASWSIMFDKWRTVRTAREEARVFENRFWSGIELVELFKLVSKRQEARGGLALLFETGFSEFARLRKQGAEPMALVEGAQRSMRVALNRQLDGLESQLAFLATVGSTSPYVGLFGTVWGIMNAFLALGGAQQATLSMVAPGIAEALIATAMGLFAAIPAVIAYNRFSTDVERLANRYDNFVQEFASLLQRRAHGAA